MPAWLIPFLIKYGLPLVLTVLQKTGFTNWAERLAIRFGVSVATALDEVKVYPDGGYPTGTNGQESGDPQITSNINKSE